MKKFKKSEEFSFFLAIKYIGGKNWNVKDVEIKILHTFIEDIKVGIAGNA